MSQNGQRRVGNSPKKTLVLATMAFVFAAAYLIVSIKTGQEILSAIILTVVMGVFEIYAFISYQKSKQ